jgi:hypothetical protein
MRTFSCHQMLFQGEKRGFDLNRALAATSVREFDEAISRVVHGYKTVNDFYSDNSSEAAVEGVRIPLLCILASYFTELVGVKCFSMIVDKHKLLVLCSRACILFTNVNAQAE